MKLKNILCLLLVLCIGFGTVACAKGSNSSTDTETGTNNSETDATSSETESEEEKPYVQPADISGSILIKTDKSKELFKSNYKYGISQVHYRWENGDFAAVKRARDLMKDVCQVGNQHIVAFGAGTLQEKEGAPLNFNSLDTLVKRMESVGGEYTLTLCSAPGWMLESEPTDGFDPESRPKEEYFDEYAAICAEVAKRYPQVKYFQIWNEFKGFWSSKLNGIDIDLYIKFYNMVYSAVKEARPDAVVGGFYGTIQGDYSSQYGYKYDCSFNPADDNAYWDRLNKWQDNAVGFDFVSCDYGVQAFKNFAKLTKDEVMNSTKNFKYALERMCKETDKPIIMAEYYGQSRSKAPEENSPEFEAAVMALIYKNMLLGVKDREYTSLFWLESPEDIACFFTETKKSTGGQPLPLYYVAKGITRGFTTGNTIVESSSADESKVEVFASSKKVMVINKTNSRQVVQYGDKYYELSGYEVIFLNTNA